jgi:hypothetical protein
MLMFEIKLNHAKRINTLACNAGKILKKKYLRILEMIYLIFLEKFSEILGRGK